MTLPGIGRPFRPSGSARDLRASGRVSGVQCGWGTLDPGGDAMELNLAGGVAMDLSFSVVIGTYGDLDHWSPLAARAHLSAEAQTVEPVDIIWEHADTLHEARNVGAVKARGQFLVFLDADDELDVNYLAAMQEAVSASMFRSDRKTFLYQPATLGIVDGREDPEPVMIPERALDTGNFMVIGTAVEKELFYQVGGFYDWPIYEDWCLWIRCHQAGAGFVKVPDAIYRVNVNLASRNNADRTTQVKYFNLIRGKYY